jgi:hypothetical protein
MKRRLRRPWTADLPAAAAQVACGAALGVIAAEWIGAGYLAGFGLFFGAIVGFFLSPIAIALFHKPEMGRAVGIAMACATLGILLSPTPRLLGPTFVNAVAGWIGSLVIMRLTMRTALASAPEPRFAVRALVLAVVAAGVFGAIHIVRSWPEPTDPASALVVVDKAFRSNAMEVHHLGHEALALVAEADADRLSRDADERVRMQLAYGLSAAQTDAFARPALERLAIDPDPYVRRAALWSLTHRWPSEVEAIDARTRADPDPMVAGSADRAPIPEPR